MLAKISKNIVSWLIECEMICKDDRELYEYAAFNYMFSLLPFFIIVPFALLTGRIINAIILISVFLHIRTYGGGYHAKTRERCFICSCSIMMVAIYLTALLHNNIYIGIIVLVSGVVTGILSPVESVNKRLEPYEEIRYRRKTQILVCLFVAIYFLLTYLGLEQYAVSAALGISLVAMLQLTGVMMKCNKNARFVSFHA